MSKQMTVDEDFDCVKVGTEQDSGRSWRILAFLFNVQNWEDPGFIKGHNLGDAEKYQGELGCQNEENNL